MTVLAALQAICGAARPRPPVAIALIACLLVGCAFWSEPEIKRAVPPNLPTSVEQVDVAAPAAPQESTAAPPTETASATVPALPVAPPGGAIEPPGVPIRIPTAPVPFDVAVLRAAESLLSTAQFEAGRQNSSAPLPIAIDPLIDGIAGEQTLATRTIAARIAAMVRERHANLMVTRFSAESLALQPLVLIGTLTGVNAEGQTTGLRQAYRIWLTLVDLKSGTVVSKAQVLAQMDGVDASPVRSFREAPMWTNDPATRAYIEACHLSNRGDAISPAYRERLGAGVLIAEAIDAYEDSQYAHSLALFKQARQLPSGNQLRVFNGIYLNSWKLKRIEDARTAFASVVDFGLARRTLAMKFVFRPSSSEFDDQGAGLSSQYRLWLSEIATGTARANVCVELVGHSSPTGPEPRNQLLSFRRAEHVRDQLVMNVPTLGKRMHVIGMGSKQNMIGTGRDNDSDALDRRVELKAYDCVLQ